MLVCFRCFTCISALVKMVFQFISAQLYPDLFFRGFGFIFYVRCKQKVRSLKRKSKKYTYRYLWTRIQNKARCTDAPHLLCEYSHIIRQNTTLLFKLCLFLSLLAKQIWSGREWKGHSILDYCRLLFQL